MFEARFEVEQELVYVLQGKPVSNLPSALCHKFNLLNELMILPRPDVINDRLRLINHPA